MSRSMFYAGAVLGAAALARSIVRRATRYELHDKVVLITGGSRGLGLVLARELVGRGAVVAICARDADELARAEADLVERGGRVLALPCDITDRDQVIELVARVRDELGPIDVLVNNAGVIDVGPIEHMTVADFQRAMATHFWGPLELVLHVVPQMRARAAGRIVNITSIGGAIAVPHLLPYTASKFALVGLSEGLRAELGRAGITVTTVVPGLMRTGSPPNATFKGHHRAEYAWFAISDSLPGVSIGAERAARRIVTAIEHGDPEVALGAPTRLAMAVHALAPGLTQRILGLVDRVLPGPGGVGARRVEGRASTSPAAPSRWTRATERAAARNNEL